MVSLDSQQPSEKQTKQSEHHAKDLAARAFGADEDKEHIQSPTAHNNKESEVYSKPIVEPLDKLPFSSRTGKPLEKSKIVSDESLNPYKNKREDKDTALPNPYKHKSKWVYAPPNAFVPATDNSNNVQAQADNFGYTTSDWTRNQQATEGRINQMRDWRQQQQDTHQQMQFEAQRQMMMHLNQEQQMQLQNAFMQQQQQQQHHYQQQEPPFVFNPNMQNFPPPNFHFNNNTNSPYENSHPNFGNNGPYFPFNHPGFGGNGPYSVSENNNNPNFGSNGPNFGPNFGNNGSFFGNEGPGFGGSRAFANNNQMGMPFHGPFPPNEQMQMPFPPNVPINFSGPPPMFMMQHPQQNGLDFINDPMRNMNPEFENGVPVRF